MMFGRLDLRPLSRLRLRLTLWYVVTFGAILLAVGTGLFFVVAHEIGVTIDRSLAATTAAMAQTIMRAEADAVTASPMQGRPSVTSIALAAARRLAIPDRSLYLFGAAGRLLYPDSASTWVRTTVAQASDGRDPTALMEASIGHDHTLRVHARKFAASGAVFVATAAADTEELGDAYAAVLWVFSLAAGLALALVAMGGIFLARQSTAPVAAAFEQMRRFMADAAHELRTPVAVLRAQADVALEQPRAPEAYRDALEEIRHETEELSGAVNDLLTLARADAGTEVVQRERLYLDDVALDVATAARALATQRQVCLDVTEYEEAIIVGDPALVRRLLMIVLDNAIKYTPSGGKVRLAITAFDSVVTVVVEDTGIGIAPEVLPRMFERFYRGISVPDRPAGAGLGLAIARWIADAHGAAIELTSAPGQGTRVTLRFPRAA